MKVVEMMYEMLNEKLDPDVILLQEVQRDITHSDKDQVTQLREIMHYQFSHFEVACIKTTRKGVTLPHPVEHGLGIISKIPFNTEAVKLVQAEGDKEPRILLMAQFKDSNDSITITNVHFANKDEWAEAHLRETLTILKNRNIKPILAGDFNIKNISNYKTEYENDYVASTDLFSYVSYPEDNVSYDYILLPKKYSFANFQCVDETVSDHKMLYATIQIKK
jgi:endonuclease/exonuclease/phosphatase family metal-dependent hydrolase